MPQQVTCPNCSRSYAFKPELAGKRAKCKCGAEIQFPATADDDVLDESDLLEDAPPETPYGGGESFEQSADAYTAPQPPDAYVEPPPVVDVPLCRTCGAPLQGRAVICTNCGTDQRTGEAIRTQVTRSLPKAAPQRAPAYTGDNSLSGTDWLLILFCSTIAFFVALFRGLNGGGWRMMITLLVIHGIIAFFALVIGFMSAAVHAR